MKLNFDAPQIDGHAELEQAVATLRARGHNPQRSGDGYTAKCVTHDDKRESLSLGVGKTGKLLLRCHANQGCGFERIRDELGINAAGRSNGDHSGNPVTAAIPAEPKKRNTVAKPTDGIPRGSTVTEAYAYTDENGATLYLILRLEPKSFRPRVPTGDGRWYTDLGDARRVLYDLPDVIATAQAGGLVYVCEGEKACERVKLEGVTATTQGGSAREWTPELIAPLAGARVIIVADADDPGRESAQRLAVALEGLAASVDLRESATGVEKDGADDHLDAGHALVDLAVLEAPVPLGPLDLPDAEPEPEDETPGRDGVRLLNLDDLLANPPPDPDYDWHGYLERGTLAVLHGDGGLGKSLIGMGLCRRYTLGKEWLGQDTSGGFALYLDGENSLAEIARRLYAFEVRPGERRLKYGRVDIPILFDPIAGDALIERLVIETGCELLVLDSQRALWGGDEREQLEVRPMYQMLASVAERLMVSILLIHHDNKSGLYSGSTDINAAVVSRLHLERYSRNDKKDRRRTLWHEKSRSGPELPEVTFSVEKTLSGVLTFLIETDDEPAYPRESTEDAEERKAPADDIAVYVMRAPKQRLKPATIQQHFGISATTLRRRRDRLAALGIVYYEAGLDSYYHAPTQLETLGSDPNIDPNTTPPYPATPEHRPEHRPEHDPATTPPHPAIAGFSPTERPDESDPASTDQSSDQDADA